MGLSVRVHPGLERSSQTSGAHHSHQCSSLHSGHVPCPEGLVEEDWHEVLVRHSDRVLLRSTVSLWLGLLSRSLTYWGKKFCWVKPILGCFFRRLFPGATAFEPKTVGKVSMKEREPYHQGAYT